MADIKTTIQQIAPEALFGTMEDGKTLVTIPDAQWHTVAMTLREQGFDFLITIVGMDWKEEGMGCIYYLTSTETKEILAIKVMAVTRMEKPMLHTVSDIWAVAEILEREVYDFFGMIFINHPDMRRIFLNIDWKGYPLRKDYDDNPDVNPVSIESERQSDFTDSWVERADGSIEHTRPRLFEEDDFVVNIGPQHPATHGVLRFRTAINGEDIKKIDVYMGYIHRGIEKLCEGLTYPQTLHFTDRMDYFSAHNYHHGLCLALEKAMGIEISERAKVIRVLMDELSRIASHCLFAGTFCMDLGATTMLFYTLRVREQILDIMERTCGARMTFNYDCIGGVMQDLYENFVRDVKALLAVLPANLKEYDKIFTGNIIARNRMIGVGKISREECINRSVTGPSGRASGWACDVRKTHPYSIYESLDFDEVVMEGGDAMDRFRVRMEEIKQSARIIEQLIDRIPEGEYLVKVPKVVKLPKGTWFQLVEGCRGAFGVFIESDGTTSPYRMKFVPPCMPLAAAVDSMSRGSKIADLITIGGSLDYIIPDMDR